MRDTQSTTRNFCIIAHVDHGKSTLADRILQITHTIPKRAMREQFLDKLPLERKRGITIKLQAIRLHFHLASSQTYTLNLIDTPGHIDFSYEVSRALAACEGALLLVDASQGIQAQTVANFTKAQEAGLTILPVINKVDLPNVQPQRLALELVETFGFKKDEILLTSAKKGHGVEKLLTAIVRRIPPPNGQINAPPRALIFDSFYDSHLGVVALVRVVDGKLTLSPNQTHSTSFRLMHVGINFRPVEIGYITAKLSPSKAILTGEVGYLATGLKDITMVQVGDTITTTQPGGGQPQQTQVVPLAGYQKPRPMVFADLFPQDGRQLTHLHQSLEKYRLSDAAFTYTTINSPGLGNGFRGGFLGLLHLEVVRERLAQEFNLRTIVTPPSVEYHLITTNGKQKRLYSPEELPPMNKIKAIYEPWAEVKIYTAQAYLGGLIKICQDRRGEFVNLTYLGQNKAKQVQLVYQLPLSEIIHDFFDQVKSISSGYASLDYRVVGERKVDLVRLDILLNKQRHIPLSRLIAREKAAKLGQELVEKVKAELPRQQFSIPVQAVIGNQVVARRNVPALRKNVTAKLYGGDRTRKDKLLKKQAAGKKRLQAQGQIRLTSKVYQKILTP